MFEIKDFQTLYNMVCASFIILTTSLLYDSYVAKGELLDLTSFFELFSGVKTLVTAWLTMAFIFFCIIFITKIALRTNRFIWIPLYIGHASLNLLVATYFARS